MEPFERVTSRQNAVVRRFRELARASSSPLSPRGAKRRAARLDDEVLLDGEHLVQEALACNVPVELAAFADRHLSGTASPVQRLAGDVRKRGGRAIAVSEPVLAAISPVRHPSGVVAIARSRAADIDVVFAAAHSAAHLPVIVVLAGLQDPGNVGAIVRAAAAFAAAGVVAVEGTANPFGWKALRGAMGGTFRLPVARATTPALVAAAQHRGTRLVAATPRGGTPLARTDFRQPTAIIVGGEGGGVSEPILAAAQASVTIAMRAPVESLNVAVAAAVILYEASRQHDS